MPFWWLMCIWWMEAVTSSSSFEKCLKDVHEVTPKKYFHLDGHSLNITLETSSRITHQLSTHVFYIYIDEVLGYNSSKIKINHYEDNFQIESVIERLSDHMITGDDTIAPPATVNLEVWTSPDYDTIAKEFVKECGSVAPPGRFGWYIPMNFSHPVKEFYRNNYMSNLWDDSFREVHWSLFLDKKLMQYFDIKSSVLESVVEGHGYNKRNGRYVCPDITCTKSMYTPHQCVNRKCAILLAPDFEASSFLITQIEETGILVKVLWLGQNLKPAIHDLLNKNILSDTQSLLIFYWTPSDIIMYERNFINVQFKNNEYYNFTQDKSVGYKYEMHRLVKLAWAKVQENAIPLYFGLRSFNFSEDDYAYLLTLYEEKARGDTVRDVACKWMRKRYSVWKRWKIQLEKPVIHIGGIFPITHSSYNGGGIATASRMAIDAINKDNILPDYRLNLLMTDGMCTPDTVMKNFIDFIVTKDYYNNLVGVLGPACSETVEPIAGVSKHYHIMVISYSAEGASFSDRRKYPYFFRTIGENQHYKHVYIHLFEKFKWKRVAALTEDGQKYTEYISLMQDDFEKKNIKFIANKKFSRENKNEDMKWNLEDLKSKKAKIIIADVVDDAARTVMCEAYKLQMTARQGYVWFLPVWLNNTWYDTDTYNANNKKDLVNCTTKQMTEAITGHLSMTHAYYAPDDSLMQENITVAQWKKQYTRELAKYHRNSSDYAGFAYDAVWTYAYALSELAKSDPEAITNLHEESTTNKLVHLVNATDFWGVSGHIKFRGGPSRFSVINILQWYDNNSHVVGSFTPNVTYADSDDIPPKIVGGILKLNSSAIKWFTEDGQVPEDGTTPPPSCAVEGLARAFDVECQTAMIILNVMVAGILFIVVIIVCFYMKRKYDKKVEKTKNYYIRSLGLPFDMTTRDLDKWEISRKCVVINRKLGEGAFGTVYGGEANFEDTGWTGVAVKTLKVGSSTDEKLDFLSEAQAMKIFEHKNIVKLMGVCTKEEPVYTIMELMLYGDLKTYLLARRHLVKNKSIDESEEVSPKRLTSMALDVARGLSYLAEMKFVHRDIACRNCLVNSQRAVKIGDFGMTRAMFDNDYYKFTRKGMLPVRWMSPESLALGVFTYASDVWSYGVLLYEIITFGSFPFQGKTNAQVLEMVKEGITLDIPKAAKPQLVGLIKSCWKRESKERPSASQIVEFLANNPRLLAPCLDSPISSIQMGDTEPIDMTPNEPQKTSPNKSMNGSVLQAPAILYDEKFELDNIPMEVCCSKQPLLGQAKSSSNLLNLGRLVGNNSRKGSDDDEEYVCQSTSAGNQDNTNV